MGQNLAQRDGKTKTACPRLRQDPRFERSLFVFLSSPPRPVSAPRLATPVRDTARDLGGPVVPAPPPRQSTGNTEFAIPLH